MLLVGLIQIFRVARLKERLPGIGLVALVIGGDDFDRAALRQAGQLEPAVIFFVVGVGALVLLGVPIAFSFGTGDLRLSRADGYHAPIVVVGRMDEGMSHLILLAVPLFVLLGLLIEMTGIARAMVSFLAEPARACSRRPFLRADRRDVPGLGHLRLEGGRYGCRCARAVPGDAASAARSLATWSPCSRRPARRPKRSRRRWC